MEKRNSILRLSGLLVLFFCMSCLAACSLFPAEEQEHNLTIVSENVSDQFNFVMAEIQDVSLTKSIPCLYSQLSEESFTFAKNGNVAYVYVKEGDDIQAGQLMASLDTAKYESELLEMNNSIEQWQLEKVQAEERIAFYNKKLSDSKTGMAKREEYRLKVLECDEVIRNMDTMIEAAAIKAEYDERQISLSRIYSTVDGTVSYVKDDLLGSSVVKDTLVMKVMDSSVCAFKATDRDAVRYVEPGQSVVVSMSNGVEYPAEINSTDPEKGTIVFYLDEPDYSLSVGTRATVYLTVDEKKGVLAVPRTAVYSTDEFSYVYVLSDEGVRELVKIEPGLVGNRYVEVLSGLNVRDSVILKKN